MQLFLKILSGMANSVDPDLKEQFDLGLQFAHANVRNFGVQNFSTFSIQV